MRPTRSSKRSSSATAAVSWIAPKTPESTFALTRARAETTSGEPTANPIRQPVIEKVFEKEKNSMKGTPLSRAAGKSGSARSP